MEFYWQVGVTLSMLLSIPHFDGQSNCSQENNGSFTKSQKYKKFISYGVTEDEGFNSRLDIFIRAANLIKSFPKEENWVLVLPPWEHLGHWKSSFSQEKIPWRRFFDVKSLKAYLDVIEMDDLLKMKAFQFDEVYILQRDLHQLAFDDTEIVERSPCLVIPGYHRDVTGLYRGILGYNELYTHDYKCLSVHGIGRNILKFLTADSAALTRKIRFVWAVFEPLLKQLDILLVQ